MGLRLLIVAESHYDEGESYSLDEQRTFTADIVKDWGAEAGGYSRFFANVYRSFNEGNAIPSSDEFRGFWNSVFFYNYVQSFVHGGPRARPTEKMFSDSAEAFHAMLDDVKPEAVIVMSKATWDKMSEKGAERIEPDEAGLGSIWHYPYEGGHCLAAHTKHPSSFGYSADEWRPRVTRFLERVRNSSAKPG